MRILTIVRALALFLAATAPALAGDVEVKGKYTLIRVPQAEKAMAERLMGIGDRAIEMYAKDLGVEIPKTPFKVFLFATIADYEKAEDARTHGTFKANLAFCHRDTSDVLMCIQPRPGRPPGEDEGMFESLFAHELCHALQYKYFPSYDDLPDWLSEGLADFWSERAIARGDALCAERSPWYSSFILEVRQAIEEKKYIPVAKLLEESVVGHDFAARQLRYAEGFAFVRMLDSPAPENAERRKKFRAFVREALKMPGGRDMPARVNERFKRVFGDVNALDAELMRHVKEDKVFPWHIVLREIRALRDGGLVCETFPQSTALAFNWAGAPLAGPKARIKADVEVIPLGSAQANLAFGFRSRTDYYVLSFGAGFVALQKFDGEWKMLARAEVDKAAFAPGKHTLMVDIDGARLWGKLDGKVLLSFTLKEGGFPKGRWGIGAYDTRVIFRNPSAQEFPASPPKPPQRGGSAPEGG
jgi:hypothetical protein